MQFAFFLTQQLVLELPMTAYINISYSLTAAYLVIVLA